MLGQFVFPRADLADAFVQRLTGPLAQGKPLILFGPRRIGKTTFLRNDLLPALRAQGLAPLYVNLWANRAAAPGDLLARAIEEATEPGWLGRTLSRVRKVEGAGFGAELADPAAADGGTVGVLRAYAEHAKKPVVLILDEAQQALASAEGSTFTYALKTAWETLNQGPEAIKRGPRLLIVMTGSSRDKLSRLAVPKGSPFFGAATPENFPPLPDDFALAYARYVNERVTRRLRLDPLALVAAFEQLGRRPEHLFRLVEVAADRMSADVPALCRELLQALAEQAGEEYRQTLSGLTDLQVAVLKRIAQRKAVFSREALAWYGEALGEPVSAAEAQTAASTLRSLGLVWNAARGHYEIEDPGFEAWLGVP